MHSGTPTRGLMCEVMAAACGSFIVYTTLSSPHSAVARVLLLACAAILIFNAVPALLGRWFPSRNRVADSRQSITAARPDVVSKLINSIGGIVLYLLIVTVDGGWDGAALAALLIGVVICVLAIGTSVLRRVG
jgi:hypothetical protein